VVSGGFRVRLGGIKSRQKGLYLSKKLGLQLLRESRGKWSKLMVCLASHWRDNGACAPRARSSSQSNPVYHLCFLISTASPWGIRVVLVRSTRSFFTSDLAFRSKVPGNNFASWVICWDRCPLGHQCNKRRLPRPSSRRAEWVHQSTPYCGPCSARPQALYTRCPSAQRVRLNATFFCKPGQ
jgi:hypothetical protein